MVVFFAGHWSFSINEMNIRHQRGRENTKADALSRSPVVQELSLAELQNHHLEHPNGTNTVVNGIILVKNLGIRIDWCSRFHYVNKLFGKLKIWTCQSEQNVEPSFSAIFLGRNNSWPLETSCGTTTYFKKLKVEEKECWTSLRLATSRANILSRRNGHNWGSWWTWLNENLYSPSNRPHHPICLGILPQSWGSGRVCFLLKGYICRGADFTTIQFQQFLKNNGVHQLFTSFQHPQCNVMNQRTNQTIVTRQ